MADPPAGVKSILNVWAIFTSLNLPTNVKVVCVEVLVRLLIPLITYGVFVQEATDGVVFPAILGSVTVNVIFVKGQNSVF